MWSLLRVAFYSPQNTWRRRCNYLDLTKYKRLSINIYKCLPTFCLQVFVCTINSTTPRVSPSVCPVLYCIPRGYPRERGVPWNHTQRVLPAHALKYVIAAITLSGRIPQGDVKSTRVVDWGMWRDSRLGNCPSDLLEAKQLGGWTLLLL
jgi:hypothetical protein